jgi:hypothetical protein
MYHMLLKAQPPFVRSAASYFRNFTDAGSNFASLPQIAEASYKVAVASKLKQPTMANSSSVHSLLPASTQHAHHSSGDQRLFYQSRSGFEMLREKRLSLQFHSTHSSFYLSHQGHCQFSFIAGFAAPLSITFCKLLTFSLYFVFLSYVVTL